MNEEEFESLRRWGEGLRLDGREEVQAAGKAIVLLCQEVERLEIALWSARDAAIQAPSDPDPRAFEAETTAELPSEQLRARVRRLLRAPFA